MSLFDRFKGRNTESQAIQAANQQRLADIGSSLRGNRVPTAIRERLEGARAGQVPWTATLTPAELLIARSHGLRPVACVSATCWLHYGWSWTEGHSQGWHTALHRLRQEALAAGANAVLDVKLRTVPFRLKDSMDFTLIGTAVYVEGLPASTDPVVATVPALEFVRLLEANVVPTGIAIGAQYDWLTDSYGFARRTWMGNIESDVLSRFWEQIRRRAFAELQSNARPQGNGVLAHVNFSQMFEVEQNDIKRYLGRHIVVATTVDAPPPARKPANMPWGPPPWGESKPAPAIPHAIGAVVDMHAGSSPLAHRRPHHQSYRSTDRDGAI